MLPHKPILALIFLAYSGFCLTACAPLQTPPVPRPGDGPATAVVLDIDGTLTPDVFAIGSPRDGAASAVRAMADQGHAIFYLSARFPWFSAGLSDWLDKHGFPGGAVFVAQSIADNRDPLPFKQDVLERIRGSGWSLVSAYGDSTTDFSAYAKMDIPRDRVFALKRRGAEACEPGAWSACLEGWSGNPVWLDVEAVRSD